MSAQTQLRQLRKAVDQLPPEEPEWALARLTEAELRRFEVLVHQDAMAPSEEAEVKRLLLVAGRGDQPAREMYASWKDRPRRTCFPAESGYVPDGVRIIETPAHAAFVQLEAALDRGDPDGIRAAMQHGALVLSAERPREETL